MSEDFSAYKGSLWGYLAIALGALGLMLSMAYIFGGPFTPQPTVGQTIGEIAGEMRASALRALNGEAQPAPVARGWDIDRIILVGAPILGVLGILSAMISALMRDPWRLPTYGAILGTAAIVFQFLWWIAVLFAAVILLVSIIENIGDILGG